MLFSSCLLDKYFLFQSASCLIIVNAYCFSKSFIKKGRTKLALLIENWANAHHNYILSKCYVYWITLFKNRRKRHFHINRVWFKITVILWISLNQKYICLLKSLPLPYFVTLSQASIYSIHCICYNLLILHCINAGTIS